VTPGIGLIGCGKIAQAVHLRVLSRARGADLVAVADPDHGAQVVAARLSRAQLYADADELLADPRVDAVVICAPSGEHARLTVAAAEAGKHLYVEKPLATNASDAADAAAAADRAGIVAAAGLNRRAHPLFELGRRLLDTGAIGRVTAVQSVFCEPLSGAALPDWKRSRETGGGVLLDLGSHHFDLLRWLLGAEIESVEASIRSDRSEHDTAWVSSTLTGGVEAQSYFSFTGLADVLELVGERGTLRLDRYLPRPLLTRRRGELSALRGVRVRPSRALLAWQLKRLVRPASEPSYRRSLLRFIGRLHGQPVELATLDDAARSLDAVLAAEESGAAGRPVGL
jgi:myo-inositol 2-dehydrogenase / D-chiro-inositol 1-dehydrogenase